MQASTITFVHVPAFDPEATARHGGVRRATQVAALARADLNCPIPARRAVPFARALRYTVIGLKELTSLPSPLRSMLKAAFAIGFLKDQLSQMRAAPETAMILVELVRGPTTYLGYWLAKKGYRFAVAPQNMEFLVPSKASRGEMDVWQYRMERSIYRAASCVLCISDFDAKIVRCLSARAVTLPYYPWKGDALRCSKIKKGRLNVSGSFKLLYVGTVNNEPSYLGLERLLAEFDHSLDSRWTLHVVGYGTARLSSAASRRAIIEGAVTDARLDEMLQECRAVLLHQPATTGFMTRLVELNLSGVPVFVNEEYSPAAGLERFGVRIYRELHEVVSLLDEPELEAFEEIKAPDTPVGRDLRSFVLEASAVK